MNGDRRGWRNKGKNGRGTKMGEMDSGEGRENEIEGELRSIADSDGRKNESPRGGEGDCGME